MMLNKRSHHGCAMKLAVKHCVVCKAIGEEPKHPYKLHMRSAKDARKREVDYYESPLHLSHNQRHVHNHGDL